MELDEQKLLAFKKEQDKSKEKISNLEGREESILQDLQENWEVENEDELKGAITELKQKESKLKTQYDEGIKELETWLEEQEIDPEEL